MPRLWKFALSGLLAASFATLRVGPALAAPATDLGNLGDTLLDDELAKLLSPPPPADKAKPRAKGGDNWLRDPAAFDRMRNGEPEPPAGEDAGASPLASVVNGMRRAEGLLLDDAGEVAAVPVQREVVAELEKLIAKMEKQCQGGQCNKEGDKKKQASKRSQPKEGEGECDKPGQGDKPGKPIAKPGGKPNQSGTTSLAGAPTAGSPADQQELMKAAWGHLPERMRERMLQGAGGEFHPEYREELQQYFRRLAERPSREAP